MSRRVVVLAMSAAAAVAALTLLACVTNPATGRSQLIFVSQEQEIRLGRQADPEIRAEYGVYEDTELAPLVKTVGEKLAATSEQPGLPYSFTLLDSPVVNAFALPGGPVYATRGLLAHAEDEAELAGVLGHEIGHVIARHGAEQMSRAQLSQLGLGVLTIAKPEWGRYGDLVGAGAGLLLLSFGRDAEREADQLGVRYLGRTGYDPYGLPRYLGVLDRLSSNRGEVLPTWLSTHPDPGERVATTSRLAAPVLQKMKAAGQQPRSDSAGFVRRLSGLVYGDDPRKGFTKGSVFHHPELRFRYEIPEGWKTSNTQSFVASVDSAESPSAQLVLRLVNEKDASGQTPEQYAARVASKSKDVSLSGRAMAINSLPAWLGEVRPSTPADAKPRGLIAWIRHRDRLYELGGIWAEQAPAGAIRALESSLRSFREETDAQVLSVKPVVLELVRASQGQTLDALCRGRSKDLAAPCEEIATLNRVADSGDLAAGRVIKLPVRQHPLFP